MFETSYVSSPLSKFVAYIGGRFTQRLLKKLVFSAHINTYMFYKAAILQALTHVKESICE